MSTPYSPLVTEYPTTPDALEAFAMGIPDEGQQRLGIAIARTLRQVVSAQGQADSAMAQARNVRQMVLSRDPRFDTLDERYAALVAATDGLAATQAQLSAIAASYEKALPASVADRVDLRAKLDVLTPRADQLRTDVTANTSAIAAEVARATAAEQVNAKAISDEATRARAAEAAEVTARQAADSTNAKAVTDEVAARQAAVTAEAKTRGDADTAEAAARTAADTALSTRIDTNTTGLAAELTARQQADATNAKAIADETTARTTADTAEAKARADADTAEAGTRASADTALGVRVTSLEALRLRGTTGTGTVASLIAAGTSNLVITLKAAMPDATYLALPVIDATSGINLSTTSVAVTAKTTTTCTVQVRNSGLSLLSSINVTVLAIQLS